MNDRTREALESQIAWRERARRGAEADAAGFTAQIAKLQGELAASHAQTWRVEKRWVGRFSGAEFTTYKGPADYKGGYTCIVPVELGAQIERAAVDAFRAALLKRLADSVTRHIGADDYSRGIRDGIGFAIGDAREEGMR